MRIARQRDGEFLASNDGTQWYATSSLGVQASDTREVIEHRSALEAALAAGPSDAVTEPDLVSPVHRPGKILAIGLNYLDHIRETGAERPERPIVFAKYPSSLTGPYDPIVVDDRLTEQADYEVELAVVIGDGDHRWLTADNAMGAVFGYTVANDVSARDWQRRDSQFSRSKSMDTFCPIGPWIVTADELPDAERRPISSLVNGEVRQDSNTDQMLFGIVDLLVFLSRTMTLEPGDVILTGTPPGVGFAMDPPQHLKPGDRVTCRIDGIGEISNPVVGPDGS